jgi:hypothetical protein
MAWTDFPAGLFTSGQILTAAQMNTYVRDNLKAVGDAWTSYTPTLVNVTQGNGTLVAKYVKAGRWVAFYVSFTLGSTSSIGGAAVTVTLPFTAAAVGAGSLWGQLTDTGTQNYAVFPIWTSTTVVTPTAINTAGTYGAAAGVATTVPFTWGNTDLLLIGGTYEASA